MITEKMKDALNDQINAELYSGYLYVAMSSYCSSIGLRGAANWFFVQNQEEMTHALRLYNYVNTVGEHVVLEAIEKPPAKFESPVAMFEAALDHEKKITARINALVDLAVGEKDRATESFLKWFVDEQVEEEESVQEILDRLKLAGDQGSGLFMVDQELQQRVFTMPVDLAAK